MLQGRASLITVIIILVMPFTFQGVLSETPPPHENFEEAEQNLQILLSLLEDSKILSEETLSYLVHMELSPENLSIAMEKANEFHELLLGAETLLNNMKGEATSYEYLTEYLTSFQNLDINTTRLIQFYIYLSENLTVVEDYLDDTANSNNTVDSAFQSLNNSESNAESMKNTVEDIENNTEAIKQNGFSTDTLEELIIETKELIDSDEDIINELVKLFTVIPNFLSIYVYKNEFSLGEELAGSGYFFGEGSFKAGQDITVFIDDQILDEVSANRTGRYEFKKDIPLNHALGVFEIHASTIFNDSLYVSEKINIKIGKIPTKLTLSTPLPAYSPNQSISFSGRLVDNQNKGLEGKNITFYFNELLGNAISSKNITTDIGGFLNFELNNMDIPFGIYTASAEFESDEVYYGSISGIVDVLINIPTEVKLSILETVAYYGENITFFGQLIDELENIPLSEMTIEIYIEDEKVGTVVTNNVGRYEYKFSTLGMPPGTYNVHSEFNPTEVKWREAQSDIIVVEIKKPEQPTPIQSKSLIDRIVDNLFLIVIFTLVILLPAAIYVRKRREVIHSDSQTNQIENKTTRRSYPKAALTKELFKETEDFENQFRLLKEKRKPREAIISGFNTLLGILEKYKIISVKPSHTHLDIAQKITEEGFPQTEVSSITTIFEKAMYSNLPVESQTVDDFMIGVNKIFAFAKGTKA